MADRGRGRGGGRGRGDSGPRGGRGGGDFGSRGGRGGGDFQPRGGRGGGDFQPRGGRGGDFGGRGGRGGRGGFGGGPVQVYGNGTFPQPDAAVTKVEDVSVKDLSTALAATSLQDNLPSRPGYGINGRKIIVWTNYFHLVADQLAKTPIYRYSVAIQPDNEIPKPKKKRLISMLLQQPPFRDVPAATDWAQVIVTTQKVKFSSGERDSFKLEWYPADGDPLPSQTADEPESRTAARRRNTHTLLVDDIGTVSVGELLQDLSSDRASAVYDLKMQTIQALNLMVTSGPSTDSQIVSAGQNKFYPFQGHAQAVVQDLTQGLEALRGYFSSVRTGPSRILLNVNVATGAFYKTGPLLDLMRDFGRPENAAGHARLAGFVRLLKIETNYIPEKDGNGKVKKAKGQTVTKRKVHRIGGLSPFGKNATNLTFSKTNSQGNAVQVTVQNFLQQEYGITLSTPQAPVVNVGNAQRQVWIPAELCNVLPGQVARRMLAPNQTRNMIEFAARQPAFNAQDIENAGLKVAKVVEGLNSHLVRFGIKVNPKMLTVHARVLEPPILRYKGSHSHKPREGKWNLADESRKPRAFFSPATIQDWNCLVISEGQFDTIRGGPGPVKDLLGIFRGTLLSYGLTMGPVKEPKAVRIKSSDIQNKDSNVSVLLTNAIKSFGAKLQFLYVLLPNDNAFLYDTIKKVCDVDLGIPNVCNIGKKFSNERGQAQYMANVALKFNLKKGGVNHYVAIDELKPLDEKTIVFGIDVTHPSPGSSESSPSIAGVVASVDSKFAQWPASIRTQKRRQEMVQGLEEMITERLRLWQSKQKTLPTKVIVYRDGVSEGQYQIVLNEEYPAFIKAFDKLYGAKAKHPKISIIVVGKRHHTRFYPTTSQDADNRTGNPLPGTVVDRGITGERIFDFYLVAHQGLQGTSKPCHYVVIKDDNKLGADQLQKLTHNLCYTFGRATRSVSICPPAYYADIVCERGRSYLHTTLKADVAEYNLQRDWHGGVHPQLKDTMFYL